MTNGLLFFWFGWMFWIIVTFFMKKSRRRTLLACWILFSLMCSNVYILIGKFDISLAFFALYGGVILFQAKLSRSIYHFFCSFTITIGYIAILLWESITPVWVFSPRVILIPIIIVLLITFLTSGFYNRLVVGLFGVSSGDIIYSAMLSSYSIQKPIGELSFFDSIILIIVFIFCFEIIQRINQKLSLSLLNSKQQLNWKMSE